MRRLKRTGRKKDLVPCPNLPKLIAPAEFDADSPLAFKQYSLSERVRFNDQVRAAAKVRLQITPEGAPAFAIKLRNLIDANAFLLKAQLLMGFATIAVIVAGV